MKKFMLLTCLVLTALMSTMAAGLRKPIFLTKQPIEVFSEGWPEGSYLIYIEIEDELYEGEFEL